MRREGDCTTKEQRYRRAEEFIEVIRRIWTENGPISHGSGSTTALVGSYETVAQALIDYTEIGCDLLSIRGWDVYEDAHDYARHVLPLVRQELARRQANGTAPILNPDSAPQLAAHGQ
jgi:alkanesulfonate monooxygenase